MRAIWNVWRQYINREKFLNAIGVIKNSSGGRIMKTLRMTYALSLVGLLAGLVIGITGSFTRASDSPAMRQLTSKELGALKGGQWVYCTGCRTFQCNVPAIGWCGPSTRITVFEMDDCLNNGNKCCLSYNPNLVAYRDYDESIGSEALTPKVVCGNNSIPCRNRCRPNYQTLSYTALGKVACAPSPC